MELISGDRHEHYITDRVTAFTAHCRERGLSITPQRLAIITALLATNRHPAAEDVFDEVRHTHPHISLATVHRTLELFCEVGEARKVTPLHTTARYDGNVEPHHHLVCVRCKRIVDVEVPEADELFRRRRSVGGYKYLGCSLEIHVLCTDCQDT